MSGDFLELPGSTAEHGPWLLGSKDNGTKLMLRNCYSKIWQKIGGYLNDGGLVITGNSGIGKSLYAVYLMWQLYQNDSSVQILWQREPTTAGGVAYWCCGSSVLKFGGADISVMLEEPSLIYVCDPSSNTTVPVTMNARTIVLSAPNHSRWKEFLKQKRATTLYMPVWTVNELEQCRAVLYPNVFTATEIENRFMVMGGIARSVLSHKLTIDNAQAEITHAVNELNFDRMIRALNEDGVGDDLSHKIVKHVPDTDFKSGSVEFLSQAVSKAVSKMVYKSDESKIASWLAALADYRLLGVIRGQIFKSHVQRKLTAGNMSITLIDLETRTLAETIKFKKAFQLVVRMSYASQRSVLCTLRVIRPPQMHTKL